MGLFKDINNMMKKSKEEKIKKEIESMRQQKTNNALEKAQFNDKRAQKLYDVGAFRMEQDNKQNTITETFYDDPEHYGYNDVEGPWDSSLREDWYVKPAIEHDMAMKASLGLLRLMQKKWSSQFDEIFCNDKLDWFVTDIFLCNINDTNKIANIIRNKHPELHSKALEIRGNEYNVNELAYNRILYKCIATDIICGNIPDKYNLYLNKLDQTYCRKLLNEFPVHGNAQTKDGRTINVAVAFWISYNVLYYKGYIKEPNDWTEIYKMLLDKLGYTGVKMIDIQTTAFTSGVSGNFFKRQYGEDVYKMCKANKAATRFLNLMKYLLINSSNYTREIEIHTCIESIFFSQRVRGRRVVKERNQLDIGFVYYTFSKEAYKIRVEKRDEKRLEEIKKDLGYE